MTRYLDVKLSIGVCTGPAASWQALWPQLKHYG